MKLRYYFREPLYAGESVQGWAPFGNFFLLATDGTTLVFHQVTTVNQEVSCQERIYHSPYEAATLLSGGIFRDNQYGEIGLETYRQKLKLYLELRREAVKTFELLLKQTYVPA